MYALIILYGMVLFLTLHNVVKFVVVQERYKSWLVLSFYILSVLVLVARIG